MPDARQTIDATEIEKLAGELAAGGRLIDDIADAVEQAAATVQRLARERVPVRTGDLARSIDVTVEGPSRAASLTVSIGSDLQYAPYVEHGTFRSQPRPFLGPAFEEGQSELRRLIDEAVDRALGG